MKNIISISDFSYEELFEKIVAGCLRQIDAAKERKPRGFHPEKKAIFFFVEPSTRTRGSYVEAARLLGWEKDVIVGAESTSLTKKESIANTARMFAIQGADVLVMRTKVEGTQKFAAEILEKSGFNVSVQNAGDGTNQHPTQTILDLVTIIEKLGRLDNFKIGFLGDLRYGRTVHSLLCALSMREGISVSLVSSPETALQEKYKRMFPGVEEGDSLELLRHCDIVYGSRLQEERFGGDTVSLQRAKGKFRLTPEILSGLRGDVLIMHPMPYVEEISPKIRMDPKVIIDFQAWCGIPARMFLLKEGYENREKKESSVLGKEIELAVVKEISLDEYFQRREEKRKEARYFYPVTKGTVIDHIPNGLGIKIRKFLSQAGKMPKEGVKHTIEDVPSAKLGKKDVLVLERMFLEDHMISAIASVAPSMTVNIIKDGLFKKVKPETPKLITGIGKCQNQNCITNQEIESEISPKFHSKPEGPVCFYCERSYAREEII